MLHAGAARADITPSVGIPLAGFWAPRPAQGIDTPLSAHALVLDSGEEVLALVSLDLIAILGSDADVAKEAIRQETGIAPEQTLIACSHTHEAPYPCPLLGGQTHAERDYMDLVQGAIVSSVRSAREGIVRAEVGFGSLRVPGLGENRRRLKGKDAFNTWQLSPAERETCPPAGPVDDELVMLAVRKGSGDPMAVLWNYPLHAHVFASDRVSADYPYYVWKKLAVGLHPALVSVFMPGACGDINLGPSAGSGSAAVEKLSVAIRQLYGTVEFSPSLLIRSRLEPVEAKLRDFSVFQEEEILRKQPHALEVCRQEWEALRSLKDGSVHTVLQAIALGGLGLAAVPGEYFTALGLEIKRTSPFATTAVVELANDYVGYIPTQEAYEQGGYELFNVRSSKVARGTGEFMAGRLLGMLAELRRGVAAGESTSSTRRDGGFQTRCG